MTEVKVDWGFPLALDWTGASIIVDELGDGRHFALLGIVTKREMLSSENRPKNVSRVTDGIVEEKAFSYYDMSVRWETTYDSVNQRFYFRAQGIKITITLKRGVLRKVDWDFAISFNWTGATATQITTKDDGKVDTGKILRFHPEGSTVFFDREEINYLFGGGHQPTASGPNLIPKTLKIYFNDTTRTFYFAGEMSSWIVTLN